MTSEVWSTEGTRTYNDTHPKSPGPSDTGRARRIECERTRNGVTWVCEVEGTKDSIVLDNINNLHLDGGLSTFEYDSEATIVTDDPTEKVAEYEPSAECWLTAINTTDEQYLECYTKD